MCSNVCVVNRSNVFKYLLQKIAAKLTMQDETLLDNVSNNAATAAYPVRSSVDDLLDDILGPNRNDPGRQKVNEALYVSQALNIPQLFYILHLLHVAQ